MAPTTDLVDDDLQPVGIGHNQPPPDTLQEQLQARFGGPAPEGEESLLARYNRLIKSFGRWDGTCTDEEQAGKLTAFIAQLNAHDKKLDKARLETTEPYRSTVNQINGWFGKFQTELQRCAAACLKQLNAFQKEQRRLAQAEADRQAREAAEAAKAAAAQAKEQVAEAVKSGDADELVAAEAALHAAKDARHDATKAAAVANTGAAAQAGARVHSDLGATAGTVASWKCDEFVREDLDLEALRTYFQNDHIHRAIREFIKGWKMQHGKDKKPVLRGAKIYEDVATRVRG